MNEQTPAVYCCSFSIDFYPCVHWLGRFGGHPGHSSKVGQGNVGVIFIFEVFEVSIIGIKTHSCDQDLSFPSECWYDLFCIIIMFGARISLEYLVSSASSVHDSVDEPNMLQRELLLWGRWLLICCLLGQLWSSWLLHFHGSILEVCWLWSDNWQVVVCMDVGALVSQYQQGILFAIWSQTPKVQQLLSGWLRMEKGASCLQGFWNVEGVGFLILTCHMEDRRTLLESEMRVWNCLSSLFLSREQALVKSKVFLLC